VWESALLAAHHQLGNLIVAVDQNRSSDRALRMLYTIVDKYADKYMSKVMNIYEFGAGTGHNLLRMRLHNFFADLYGFDWARSSVKVMKRLGLTVKQFDFFNPDYKIVLEENSAVYTVAALEQTGNMYHAFVEYLLRNKPSIVVHIEPIPELLDKTKLIDYLSIKYMEKRKYLSDYLIYLKELERDGKIKILETRRSGIGSKMLDGYSVIAWKPT